MPVIIKEKVLLLSTSANTHFHQECAIITKKIHNFVTIINIKGNASRCPVDINNNNSTVIWQILVIRYVFR